MERFQGIIGIIVIIIIAYLFSNNKSKINYRLVMSGLLLQFTIGVLILKIPAVTHFFQIIGRGMGKIEQFARAGAAFVYSGVAATTPSGVADFANGGFATLRPPNSDHVDYVLQYVLAAVSKLCRGPIDFVSQHLYGCQAVCEDVHWFVSGCITECCQYAC